MIILLMAAVVFVLLFIEKQRFHANWDKKLSVSLSFTQEALRCGEKGRFAEIIRNEKKSGIYLLKVRFVADRHLEFEQERGAVTTDQFYRKDLFHVKGMEQITRTLSFRAGKRGFYQISGLELLAQDFLFQTKELSQLETKASVYVYPKHLVSMELSKLIGQMNGELLSRQFWPEDPFNYRGIREYQPYDSSKRINHSASARTGNLMVNEFAAPKERRVHLVLDVSPYIAYGREIDALREALISAACTFGDAMLEGGASVSFFSNGCNCFSGEPSHIPKAVGIAGMHQLNKCMAELDLEKEVQEIHCYENAVKGESESAMRIVFSLVPYTKQTGLEQLKEKSSTSFQYVRIYDTRERTEVLQEQTIENAVEIGVTL